MIHLIVHVHAYSHNMASTMPSPLSCAVGYVKKKKKGMFMVIGDFGGKVV